jgi:hypothetical protein
MADKPNQTTADRLAQLLTDAGSEFDQIDLATDGKITITVPPPSKPKIVKYQVYAHASEESMWERARDAGFTDDEVAALGLGYVGLEIRGDVTVDTENRTYTVEWDKKV